MLVNWIVVKLITYLIFSWRKPFLNCINIFQRHSTNISLPSNNLSNSPSLLEIVSDLHEVTDITIIFSFLMATHFYGWFYNKIFTTISLKICMKSQKKISITNLDGNRKRRSAEIFAPSWEINNFLFHKSMRFNTSFIGMEKRLQKIGIYYSRIFMFTPITALNGN